MSVLVSASAAAAALDRHVREDSPPSSPPTRSLFGALATTGKGRTEPRNSSVSPLPLGTAGECEQQPQMKEPHISTMYDKRDVMTKFFGVTQEQALRTQALLRLGVTDEDVRIAERLMGPRSAGDNVRY